MATLTINSVIQCDGYRLKVTAIKSQKPTSKETKKMNFFPTSEKATVNNYPYGREKATAYFSIEFKSGKGFRKVFQTINPKTGRLNAPKYSTYYTVMLLNKNEENGHIENWTLGFNGAEKINSGCKFMAKYFDLFTSEQIKYIYRELNMYLCTDYKATVIYTGADKEALLPLYKGFISLSKKGYETGENVFSEIVLDIQAINALKQPDFQPFKVVQYGE